jgi:copper chaperone
MLFQVNGPIEDSGAIVAALRMLDPRSTVACDLQAGRIDVSAQLTSAQVLTALAGLGYQASRASEPRQIHVGGGSDCCGSCS